MIELTVDKAVTLLREAVADRGKDYIYWPQENFETGILDCVYVHGTELTCVDGEGGEYEERATGDLTPGCIVGHALISAGVHPQLFLDLGLNRDTPASTALKVLTESGALGRVDPGVEELFTVAQNYQDNRLPWGGTVDTAVKEVTGGNANKG